jgi:hypothetical protein
MNEPIRQHLVPRVYLKQFALNKRKDWFIDAYDVVEKKHITGLNINNICVKKDFYTFKKLPDDHKRFLEHFYGNTVESDYPQIYQALVNPKHHKISDNFRFKIISYVISQYWRTSKLTNSFSKFWNKTMEHAYNLMETYSPERVIQSGDQIINFENRTLEEYTIESDNANRELINADSYRRFRELTLRRINNGIAIYKVHPAHRLITSDNPVSTSENIYDPSSFIRLPIDSHHILTLVPFENEVLFDNKTIARTNLDERASYFQTTVFNHSQFGQSEKFVLGHKDHIDYVVEQKENLDQQKFKEECEGYTKQMQNNLEIIKKVFQV